MTGLAWLFLSTTVVFFLAYLGARKLEERARADAKLALEQTARALKTADDFRALVRRLAQSNNVLAGMLAKAIERIKKHDDEGEEWKRG